MAISATTAEDTWFNGHKTTLSGFGGGICAGSNSNNTIVEHLDIIDADTVVSSGCTSVAGTKPSVEFRDASNVYCANAGDSDDEEAICNSRIEDDYSGHRLLLSTLSPCAVLPARPPECPFRSKKSFFFKRKRRPRLSNVVEIYEHSSAACRGGDKGAVFSECKRRGGGGGGGGENDDAVVQKEKTQSVRRDSAVVTRGFVADVRTARTAEKVSGDFAVTGGSTTLISYTSCNSVSCISPSCTVSSVIRLTDNKRLPSRACDLRDERSASCADAEHCSNSIKNRDARTSEACYEDALENFLSANRRVFSNSNGDNDDDDVCDVVGRGGSGNGESSVNYMRSRRTTCSSLAEYEDGVGEIGVDSEERVVLLQRSASVPDDGALSTPPAKRTTKVTSVTRVDYVDDEHNSVPLLSPMKLPERVPSPTVPRTMTSSGIKLGRWSKSKIDLKVPSLKSLVTMATNKLSASRPANLNYWRNGGNNCSSSSRFDVRTFGSPVNATLRRNISLNSVANRHSVDVGNALKNASSDDMRLVNQKLRKCNTMLTLSSCVGRNCSSSGGVTHVEPLRMVNRLRMNSNVQEPPLPLSRICSRCSSILSMASSSRYSLNSSYGFVPVSAPTVLCKVCLNEVPIKDSWTLQHCECSYCVDCVRSYVEFEINQGAYSISCPDAQCEKQGIILLEEIESLVSLEYIEKHKRYRLNTEVEMDKSRTWCPRAGCETVCTLCSTDRCTPQCVHCPTCNMDFCSNCRVSWHANSPCKSEDAVPGVTFDSELIKCCPMCSVPIEKDEGCAQMLCKRCKHVFCWYCLASLDDDFLLRHYDKGPCKNKLGHSRASVIWHRTQVISIFAGFGILLLIASPLLLLAAPCIVCCKCRVCTSDSKLDADDDLPEGAELQPNFEVLPTENDATEGSNDVQS